MAEREPSQFVRDMPTANLVVALQKLARNVSLWSPDYRASLLQEAAQRLTKYRLRERALKLPDQKRIR